MQKEGERGMEPCSRLLRNEGKGETETRLQREGETGRVVGGASLPEASSA